ncbi:ICOS ligand-like isoform X2 [Ascaphus truei]|uniref:ICOS ligand-like isoform X2 n=1 Tax=Ascaphus truei TaxID=8439 RepID=UPI003F594C10
MAETPYTQALTCHWKVSSWLLLPLLWIVVSVRGINAGLVGRAGGSVEMPCELSPLERYPLEQLLVYWQHETAGDPVTVAFVNLGQFNASYQHQRYRDRAKLSPEGLMNGNFSLRLSRLVWEDQGKYDCIKIWRPDIHHVVGKSSMDLEVAAGFSSPVVTSSVSGPVEYGQEVTLTCWSHGGFPEPEVLWVNSSDGAPLRGGQVQSDITQHGNTFNVTSTIIINVTSSSSVTCNVTNSKLQDTVTSLLYVLQMRSPGDPGNDAQRQVPKAVPATLGVLAVVCVLAAGVLWLAKSNLCKKYRGVQQEEHAVTATQTRDM